MNELEILLINSIKDQMVADVPVGAFLSGGIDSSLITTIMQQNSSKPVKTFSIGFEDDNYNEAKYANEISKFLQTDHNEFYVHAKDALNIIPKLPEIYDEPFADSSQIPTYLLSHLAQKQVKVVLTGDGGDELFGGYNRHFWVKYIWNRIRFLPSFIRKLSSNMIDRTSINKWDKIFNLLMYINPTKFNISQPGKKSS